VNTRNAAKLLAARLVWFAFKTMVDWTVALGMRRTQLVRW